MRIVQRAVTAGVVAGLTAGVLAAIAWLSVGGAAPQADAAADPPPNTEVRTFAVKVDGKPAGTFTMTAKADEGTVSITAVADIQVRQSLVTYKYALQSTEVWKAGRLVSVDATANDDGKKHAVKANAVAAGLVVTANGKSMQARGDAISTTGWVLPDPRATEVTLLDTEDGSETTVKVKSLGAGTVPVAGQAIEGQRYQLTGEGVDTEWWFDGAGRPIYQRMTWDGHKVILELTKIAR